MKSRHVFLADVHLRRDDVRRRETFVRLVDGLAEADVRLYVLGDLFDFWLGPAQLEVEPEWQTVFDALGRVTAAGGQVTFFHGNRDYCMGRYLTRAIGAETVPHSTTIDLDGRRVLLTHSDMLCTCDQLYHVARRFTRGRLFSAVWWCVPSRLKFGCYRVYRNISRRQDRERRASRHGIDRAALRALVRRGIDVVVCGHVHAPSDRPFRHAGRTLRVITLPTWDDRPAVLEWTGGDFVLTPVEST